MSLPVNQVVHGNAFTVLKEFPEESIDLVMFSPPYWGLRDYGKIEQVFGGELGCEHEWVDDDTRFGNMGGGENKKEVTPNYRDNLPKRNFCVKCGAWKGQFGLEPHPSMWISHMVELCRLLRRVLKKKGSLYLNVGDTYFGGKGQSGRKDHNLEQRRAEGRTLQKREWTLMDRDAPQDLCKQDGKWLQPKQLLLMPSRLAIALQDDGWVLRNDICWHKPNHMPSSVKDRLTNSWEHIFHFVKARRYFYDLDAIRKPHKEPIRKLKASKTKYPSDHSLGRLSASRDHYRVLGLPEGNPLGKNPGDTITTRESLRQKKIEKGYLISGNVGGITGSMYPKDQQGHPLGKNPSDFWSIKDTNRIFLTPKEDKYLAKLWGKFIELHGKDETDAYNMDIGYLYDCIKKTLEVTSHTPIDFWSINTKPFKGAHFLLLKSLTILTVTGLLTSPKPNTTAGFS